MYRSDQVWDENGHEEDIDEDEEKAKQSDHVGSQP